VCSLAYAYPRSKSQLIQTIISDVYDQRQQFLCLSEPTLNFNLYIVRFFQSRYGNDVASTLRDLRLPHHFQKDILRSECLNIYGPVHTTWLVQSHAEMLAKLTHVSKAHVFQSLRQLPFNIRPSYDFCQVRICQQTLISHVRL
jgi:hypothetical protein